jgi:NAD/NADP transhydrogenase beta subunit
MDLQRPCRYVQVRRGVFGAHHRAGRRGGAAGYAGQVVIVRGYGLAQAQHVARELGELLMARGATVRYAIHPVAGRMRGT